MNLKYVKLLLGVILSVVFVTGSHATLIEFRGSDVGAGPGDARPNADAAAAAFDAAAGSTTIIDFEQAPLGGFTSLSSAQLGVAGVSLSPLGASDGNDSAIETGGTKLLGYNTTNSGRKYLDLGEFDDTGEPAVGVRFDFTNPIFEFGGYFTGIGNIIGNTTIEFFDGASQILSLTKHAEGGVEFFGFTSTVGIHYIDFLLSPVSGSSSEEIGLDDVRFSTQVPEPTTLALMGLGLAGIGWKRRKAA